jgi:hypothetical protein
MKYPNKDLDENTIPATNCNVVYYQQPENYSTFPNYKPPENKHNADLNFKPSQSKSEIPIPCDKNQKVVHRPS